MKHFPSLSDSAFKEPGSDYTNETDDETNAKNTDGELKKLSVKLKLMVRQMN